MMRKNNRAKAEGLIKERYLTVTANRRKDESAEDFFERFGKDFGKKLHNRGSNLERKNIRDRMEIFCDFYRVGEEENYTFDLEATMRRRSSWKDYICPARMRFHHMYFEMGEKFGRVLFLNDIYLSRLFERFYSESRKYGGYITGIVQNVNKLLHTEAARNMLSNSEIVVMFKQSTIDAAELRDLYNLSKIQTEKLINTEEGCGLFKCGNQFISFDGRIEKGYIYDLADTKPKGEY